MSPSSPRTWSPTISRSWSGALLITAGATWAFVRCLDAPTLLGLYRFGVSPAAIELALAVVTLVGVVSSVSSGSIRTTRTVAALLGLTLVFRTAERALPLLPHAADLDPGEPLALTASALDASVLISLAATVVLAVLTRSAQHPAVWLLLAALVTAVAGGIGLPRVLAVLSSLLVSLALALAGLMVLRRAGSS